MPILRRALPLALILAALPASAAPAAPDQASIMMDDDLLLYRSDHARTRALVKMKSLGVDAVRATVLWRVVAEGADPTAAEIRAQKTRRKRADARRQKARFKPKEPRTYPTRNWDRYDNLVKDASRLGLRVYFTVTGPGPRWAHRTAPPSQRTNQSSYKPSPAHFRSFVQAVGRRYSGSYRDENALRRPLPRVTLWSLWNEANQPGWLSPQYERRDGQVVPASPALYRKLYQFGKQGLALSGHGNDVVFIGETAPLGSSAKPAPRTPMPPGLFVRELACVSAAGARYAGPDAARRDCDDFAKLGALRATGFAHHPYTRRRAPTVLPTRPDEYTMANTQAFGTMLDTVAVQSGGMLAAGLPIFLTEFGYESNPPDPRNGVTPARQAEFNTLGEFLSYQDPRVKANTQFLLRDAGPLKRFAKGSRNYWFTYQSGLFTQTGRGKPAAFAYALPLVGYPAGPGLVGFWGQLRFRPNGAQDVAVITWRPNPQTPWQQIGPPLPTNFRGFFSGTYPIPAPGAEYRAVYVNPQTGRNEAVSLNIKPAV